MNRFGCSTKRQSKPFACCPRKTAKSKGFSDSGQIEACVFLFGWTEICLGLLRWGKKNERFGKRLEVRLKIRVSL